MKKQNERDTRNRRILARTLARELSANELREVAGSTAGNTSTATFLGDCDRVEQ